MAYITCIDPVTGEPTSVPAGGVGNDGSTHSSFPNLMAKRINLSIQDVQRTIAEGRAAGFKPFGIFNTGLGYPNPSSKSMNAITYIRKQ